MKALVFVIASSCVILTAMIQVIRDDLSQAYTVLFIAPNFLAVFGTTLFARLISKRKGLSWSAGILVGALAYEVSQVWEAERTFDPLDLVMSVLGFVCGTLLWHAVRLHSEDEACRT